MWIPSRSRRWAPVIAVAIAMVVVRPARADDDPMALFRERFKSGMERYRAGDIAAAIRFWEPIYTELGPSLGYRLSFNLARAYDAFGDSSRAAERYGSFLAEVQARRAAGEAIEPLVAREETEAKERLVAIAAAKGRIDVVAASRPVSVQIDALEPRLAPFVVYVAPGLHVVTIDPGTPAAERREVTAAAGETIAIAPSVAVETPPEPPVASVTPPPATEPPRTVRQTDRPFSPVILYVAGAATAAGVVVSSIEYAGALSARADYDGAASNSDKQRARDEYNAIRPGAYAALAVTAGAAAITGALVTWYFVGGRARDVPAAAVITPVAGGATVGAVGRF
jgi:hypothetical protein